MLAPQMYSFFFKEAPRNQSPKRVPPKSQTTSGRDKRKAGWLPESPPLASKSCLDNWQETTTTQQKHKQLHNCCFDRLFVFWFLVGFRFQCRLSPWSCWRSGNKFLKEDTVLRLRNSDGWRDDFWRLFRTRSVMGRLWDDHFRDLGYPPKFYRGQDAGFDSGSSS